MPQPLAAGPGHALDGGAVQVAGSLRRREEAIGEENRVHRSGYHQHYGEAAAALERRREYSVGARRQSHLRKRFRNKPAEELRTLKVHLAAGTIRLWIDSAVERITAYGKQQKCRILLLMAQKGWRKMVLRFWSDDWDVIAYSRDRVENVRGSDPRYLRYWGAQRVGYYRILEPVEKRKKEGCTGYRLRFELKELR